MSIFNIFFKSVWRKVLSFTIALIALMWGGYHVATSLASTADPRVMLLDELQREDPSAHEKMQILAQKYGDDAIKLVSEYYTQRFEQSAMDMLSQDLESSKAEKMVTLSALYIQGQGYMSDEVKEIYSLIAIQFYKSDQSAEEQGICVSLIDLMQQYASRSQEDQSWKDLYTQPFSIAVYITLHTQQSEDAQHLWDYYCENVSWLGEALTLLGFFDIRGDETPSEAAAGEMDSVTNYIRLCRRYPAMAEYSNDIVEQWNHHSEHKDTQDDSPWLPDVDCAITIPAIYSLFDSQGDILTELHERSTAPISECVDILLANNGVFQQARDKGTLNALMDSLVKLYREDKEVWSIICMEPNSLLVYRDHPEKAKNILHTYQAEAVSDLIVRAAMDPLGKLNSDAVRNGVEAVSRYKALAIYVLRKYGGDHRFHTMLSHDFRSVLYLHMKGEQGFSHLTSDKANGYLNEYLDRNGDPRSPDWYENVPLIGTQLKCLYDLKMGYPVSFSELSWAVLDTIEIVSTVASLGSATVITTGVKTSIKQTVKESMQVSVRRTIKGSSRDKVITAIEEAKGFSGRSRYLHGRISAHESEGVALSFNKIKITLSEAVTSYAQSSMGSNKGGAISSALIRKPKKTSHKVRTAARAIFALSVLHSSKARSKQQASIINVNELICAKHIGIQAVYKDMMSSDHAESSPIFFPLLALGAFLILAFLLCLFIALSRQGDGTLKVNK